MRSFCFLYPTARWLLLATLLIILYSLLMAGLSCIATFVVDYCKHQADYCSARFECLASLQSLLFPPCRLVAICFTMLAPCCTVLATRLSCLVSCCSKLSFRCLLPSTRSTVLASQFLFIAASCSLRDLFSHSSFRWFRL